MYFAVVLYTPMHYLHDFIYTCYGSMIKPFRIKSTSRQNKSIQSTTLKNLPEREVYSAPRPSTEY